MTGPPRGEVHAWCVTLDVPPETSASLYAILTADERERSARLRFESDRRRLVVARGALREILGRYLGAPAGQIRFVYNAFGKPALSPAFGSRLRFNLSHSGDCALIAVVADADVGVDVEQVRPLPDQAEIARHFFSATEVDELSQVPSHLRAHAFFCCWTRKEAQVKARGAGLESTDLRPAQRWSRYQIEPAPGYIGALVVEGRGWRLAPLASWPVPPVACSVSPTPM